MKILIQLPCIAFLLLALLLLGCEYPNADTPPDAVAEVAHPEGYCDDLSGSWEMVFRTVTTADSIYTQDQAQAPTLKVLNDTHWMFVRHHSDGEFVMARGGPYRLEDGQYTEIVGYTSVPGNVGSEYVFECEMVDDSWHHKGQVGDERVDEIWQRVDTEESAM